MGGILLPAACCCLEENSCDDCESPRGNTDQFTVAFSDVAICDGCFYHEYGGFVKWMTPPSPALAASYVLDQVAPDPGGGCIWRYIGEIAGTYAFYGAGDSECESWVQSRSLDRIFVELRIEAAPAPLRMKLLAYYYKTTVSTSKAYIFGGETITATPCFGTTVVDNDLTTCEDDADYTVWGYAAQLNGIAGSYTHGQATVDVVVP